MEENSGLFSTHFGAFPLAVVHLTLKEGDIW